MHGLWRTKDSGNSPTGLTLTEAQLRSPCPPASLHSHTRAAVYYNLLAENQSVWGVKVHCSAEQGPSLVVTVVCNRQTTALLHGCQAKLALKTHVCRSRF
jgi:hypothetical protein